MAQSDDESRPGRLAPADLGARIAGLREDAGLTVDQVADRTRIRAGLLRAMESGDFAPCGGAVYARGHLRSIAHVVGADAQELVDAYDRMAGQPSPSQATIAEAPHEKAVHVPFAELSEHPLPPPLQVTGDRDPSAALPPRPSPGGPDLRMPGSALRVRRGSPLLLVLVGVAAIVVVIAAIVLAIPTHHSTPTAALSPSVATAHSPKPPPATPTAPQTLADAGVNVIVAIGSKSSWVHVTGSGGALLFQGTLTPGTSKSFHDAQQLSFVFGYAPAVDLTYNGRDIGAPQSGGGDVAKVTFGPQSVSE